MNAAQRAVALAVLAVAAAAAGAGASGLEREDAAALPIEVAYLGTEYCGETDATTFRYAVRTHAADMSHLVLGVRCEVETELRENPEDAWEAVGNERFTGVTGFRWLLGQDSGREDEYSLVMAGAVGTGDAVPYGVTMHGRVGVGAIRGPDCTAPSAYPAFPAPPADALLECGDPREATPAGAEDESTGLPGACGAARVILRTRRLGEGALVTKQTSRLEVDDTAAPVMSHESHNRTFECGAGELPPADDVTATDACEGPLEAKYCETEEPVRCPSERFVVRTWTAVDDCGNSACTTHSLRVVDTTPPVLHGVPENDESVECDGEAHFPPIETVNVTATDSCGDEPCWADPAEPLRRRQTRVDGSCVGNFAVEREWYAEDCCGNHARRRQLVLVRDTQPPVLRWEGTGTEQPANRTVTDCNAVPRPPAATATDACGNVSVPVEHGVDVHEDGGCPYSYRVHWDWTAKDECGNEVVRQTTVLVRDPRGPDWVGETDKVRNVTVACDAVPEVPEVRLEGPCGDTNVTFREWVNATDCENVYDVWREWVGEWGCNETRRLVQLVRVRDTDAPRFDAGTVPAHERLQCAAEVGTHAAGTVALQGEPEECDEYANVTWREEREPRGCANNLVVRRHWRAEDCAGNAGTAEQVIDVNDTTLPVLANLPNTTELTVHCHEVPGPRRVTATDNCATAPLEVRVEDLGRPDAGCSYNFTRRYSAADACGNEARFDRLIVVQDGAAPRFLGGQLPEDQTLECGEPAQATLHAFDECADVEVEAWNVTEASGVCHENRVVHFFWRAEDDCGNAAEHNQTVRTADTLPPVPEANPPVCYLPVAHAPYHVVHNVTRPNEFFGVSDACTEVTLRIDSCLSDQDDHFEGLELGVPFPGFHEDCYYNASDDTLRVRVRFDWRENDGRVFQVLGTATDACGNAAPVNRSVWLPRDDRSSRPGFDYAECGDVPLECNGACPCGYNPAECNAAELDASVTFHNVVPATDESSTFSYSVGGDMRPSRVMVAVDLTTVQILEVSPDSRVELGAQDDTFLSGLTWHAGPLGTEPASKFTFTVAGRSLPTQMVPAQLLMADTGGLDAPCSHPYEVSGPGAVQYPSAYATVGGRVLVAGAAHGESRDAALPLAGAIVSLRASAGAPRQLTMTDAEGRYTFRVPALGDGAELALEADGALRREAGGRSWAEFVTADGATLLRPYGAPLEAAEGDGNDLALLINTREVSRYDVPNPGGEFKGRSRSVAWWRHNLLTGKAGAYGAAVVTPSELAGACAAADAQLGTCNGASVGDLLTGDDDDLAALGAAVLNHVSGRGIFDPYRPVERVFIGYAKDSLCRPAASRVEADAAESVRALRRLLEAY